MISFNRDAISCSYYVPFPYIVVFHILTRRVVLFFSSIVPGPFLVFYILFFYFNVTIHIESGYIILNGVSPGGGFHYEAVYEDMLP